MITPLLDANLLEPGDYVAQIRDELASGEKVDESCHCSIVASTSDYKTQTGELFQVSVPTHGLLPGDVIQNKEDREGGGDCHCDYVFTVSRMPGSGVHPLPLYTRVYHGGQQWHRSHMNGTAVVIGIYGPRHDGSFEYRVMAGEDFSRRTGPDNPEVRITEWASAVVGKAN